MTTSLIVLAKRPRPGAVKTRLCPPLTPEQAADVAAAALRDTLRAVSSAPATSRILAFDDEPHGWLPHGWRLVRQSDGGLDVRLAAAVTAAGRQPALLVGMDTPQVRPEWLGEFDSRRYDACLGPSTDGGYWAIGLRDTRCAADAIHGIPMSSTETYERQEDRLRALGLRVQRLPTLTDVDTVSSAEDVATDAQGSEFARVFRALELVRS